MQSRTRTVVLTPSSINKSQTAVYSECGYNYMYDHFPQRKKWQNVLNVFSQSTALQRGAFPGYYPIILILLKNGFHNVNSCDLSSEHHLRPLTTYSNCTHFCPLRSATGDKLINVTMCAGEGAGPDAHYRESYYRYGLKVTLQAELQ